MPTFVTYNTEGLARMPWLARNLSLARPDVICLQEVDDRLEGFASEHLGGRFPYLARPPGNDPRAMNVAVLSRFPLLEVVSHSTHRFPLLDESRDSRFSRDLLRVDLELEGRPWSVYTTHLKSMRGGSNAHRQRESEAAAILQLLQEQVQPGRPWILTGDLNDGRHSATLARFLTSPLQLHNSLEVVGARRTFTFPCQGARQQFDYILLPHWLAPSLKHSKVWPESRASDHAMVSARFE